MTKLKPNEFQVVSKTKILQNKDLRRGPKNAKLALDRSLEAHSVCFLCLSLAAQK